jgi:hypothetical protein
MKRVKHAMHEPLSTDPLARHSQQPDLGDMPARATHQPGPVAEVSPTGKQPRRAAAPLAEAPHSTEEVAVVLVGQERRQGRRVGSRTPAPLTAQQAYDLS